MLHYQAQITANNNTSKRNQMMTTKITCIIFFTGCSTVSLQASDNNYHLFSCLRIVFSRNLFNGIQKCHIALHYYYYYYHYYYYYLKRLAMQSWERAINTLSVRRPPTLQHQPIEWKKRKGKQQETKSELAARPMKRHWPWSWNPPVPHHRTLGH